MVLRERGRLEEAEGLFRSALAIRREATGVRRLDLAETLECLAGLRQEQGDSEEAGQLRREALSIRRAFLPEEHPDVRRLLLPTEAHARDG